MQENASMNKIIEKLDDFQENCCNYVSLSQRNRQLSKIQMTHIFSLKWNLKKYERRMKNFAEL